MNKITIITKAKLSKEGFKPKTTSIDRVIDEITEKSGVHAQIDALTPHQILDIISKEKPKKGGANGEAKKPS